MQNSIEKFATYNIENLSDAIVLISASIITILIEIVIAYIIYRIIKRLIRYGIDYYFMKKDAYEARQAIDKIEQDIKNHKETFRVNDQTPAAE